MTENLDQRAEAIKLQAFAPNTLKTRRSQWNQFYKFCSDYELKPFPVTPQNVCRFLVAVGDTLTYSTLNNYVSALNSLAKYYDGDSDLRKDYGVLLLLRGFKRIKGDSAKQKDPLSPTDLKKISCFVNFSDRSQFTVWLIIVLAFRTLLRKSHFVSTSEDDQEHLLRCGDVSFHSWGCKLTINSSKTIQFHERSFEIPVCFAKEPLCAASLLKTYLMGSNKSDSDYLFTTKCNGKDLPVRYSTALDCLKSWCYLAALNKDIGFHSLRRGAASFMHSLSIPLVSIQKAGDWQSLCVLHYLSIDFEQKKDIERVVSSSL